MVKRTLETFGENEKNPKHRTDLSRYRYKIYFVNEQEPVVSNGGGAGIYSYKDLMDRITEEYPNELREVSKIELELY